MNAYLLLAYDHTTGETKIDIFSEDCPTAQSSTGGYEIYAVVQSIENEPNALAMMEEELDRLASFHPGYAKFRDARAERLSPKAGCMYGVTLDSDKSRKLRAMRYADQTDEEIEQFVMTGAAGLRLGMLSWRTYEEGVLVIALGDDFWSVHPGDWVVMEGNKVSHVIPPSVFDIMFTVA